MPKQYQWCQSALGREKGQVEELEPEDRLTEVWLHAGIIVPKGQTYPEPNPRPDEQQAAAAPVTTMEAIAPAMAGEGGEDHVD